MKIKPLYWIIAGIIIVFTISTLGSYSAEWYDKFGLVTFGFLAVLGFWMLKTKKETSDLLAFIVFILAILGLIIDGYNVFGGLR